MESQKEQETPAFRSALTLGKISPFWNPSAPEAHWQVKTEK